MDDSIKSVCSGLARALTTNLVSHLLGECVQDRTTPIGQVQKDQLHYLVSQEKLITVQAMNFIITSPNGGGLLDSSICLHLK